MNLFIGIVGLPNVGKSTLFNTITNSNVEAANYPFATIKPNVGVVAVPDERLTKLAQLIHPKKVTPAICQFVDIAGLVKNASKGEGLGNQFLANIRETHAICHVIRCFEDKAITHVYDNVDPKRDMEIVNVELIISDLDLVNKKIEKNYRKGQSGDKLAQKLIALYTKIKDHLSQNKLIKDLSLEEEEKQTIKHDGFLTAKPVLYIANVDDASQEAIVNNKHYQKLKSLLSTNDLLLPVSIKLEYEISLLNDQERQEFIQSLNLSYTGLDKLIMMAYKLLNLSSFFTFGEDEVKAWTFNNGMLAPECAGLIHSDIQKGFIRVEVMNSSDLINLKSEKNVRAAGLLRVEGKDYVIKDGDVCYFRFNI